MNVLPDWGENSFNSTEQKTNNVYYQPSLFDENLDSHQSISTIKDLMKQFLNTIQEMQLSNLAGSELEKAEKKLSDYINQNSELKTELIKQVLFYDKNGPIPFPKISKPPINLNEHLSKYKDNGIDIEEPF